jgi:polysaccharide biosynthesis protein PslJ
VIRPSGLGDRAVPVAIVATTALVVVAAAFLSGSGNRLGQQLGIAIVMLAVGGATVLLHPTWIYRSLAFVLGAAPWAIVPGFGQPVIQVLAFAVWCAILTHPIAETRTTWLELAVGLMVVTSLVSLIMTAVGVRDITEFIKWFMSTSMVFALLRLDRRELRTFGKVFVYGAFLGAVFALGIFFLDKAATTLDRLSIIGYGRTGIVGTHLRFYTVEDSIIIRLTGTYVDPNAAGIFMLVALAVAVALLRGWQRLIVAPVILVALIICLSRGAIFSVLSGMIFYLIFQRISTGRRLAMLASTIVVCAAAMTVPPIYARLMSSFGASDRGSRDRAAGYAYYFESMRGGWWFGHGWGLPEFTNDVVGWKTNYIANSPLLSIYRGGIFVGIAFVVVLIAGTVRAYRNARKQPWESGVIGALFVGFALVGLQLDFPVVTLASLTMAWSVLIVFLCANPISEEPSDQALRSVPQGRADSTRGSTPTGHRDVAGV